MEVCGFGSVCAKAQVVEVVVHGDDNDDDDEVNHAKGNVSESI
jgi:hypothetical protein